MKYQRPHILDSGILIYPKRGWEPPPLVEGYRRKSDDPKNSDAWILLPVWKDCPFRKQIQIKKEGCRCITFYHICVHDNIGYGTKANLNLCSSCNLYLENA